MNRLEWPEKWIRLTQRIGWALLLVLVLGLLLDWLWIVPAAAAIGAGICFAFAWRMQRVPMLAVENGELLCHISTGSVSGGGGRLFQVYRYALADIEKIEEHVFPYGSGRARSKFVLQLWQSEPSLTSRIFRTPTIWLIPQPLDESMRDRMRAFLSQHWPGGIEQRVMDKPPWKR